MLNIFWPTFFFATIGRGHVTGIIEPTGVSSDAKNVMSNIGKVLSSIGAPSGAVGWMEDGAPLWALLCCAVVAPPWFECCRADAVT